MAVNGRNLAVSTTTTVLQAAAAATGNGTALPLIPGALVNVRVVGADTPSFTLSSEISYDGGSTYEAFALAVSTTLAAALTTVIAGTTPVNGTFTAPPGATHFRSRVSTFVTGTATVTAYQTGMQ